MGESWCQQARLIAGSCATRCIGNSDSNDTEEHRAQEPCSAQATDIALRTEVEPAPAPERSRRIPKDAWMALPIAGEKRSYDRMPSIQR